MNFTGFENVIESVIERESIRRAAAARAVQKAQEEVEQRNKKLQHKRGKLLKKRFSERFFFSNRTSNTQSRNDLHEEAASPTRQQCPVIVINGEPKPVLKKRISIISCWKSSPDLDC